MFPYHVAIDLEMTGVDLATDEIIEIGAVRFGLDGPVERFSTLVNPGRTLPRRIESLTGIKAAEVKAAPEFDAVRDAFVKFVGDVPVVGQHIATDLGFLKKQGLVPDGPVYDTAEIAELLLPGRAEYSLRGLMKYFGIDFPVQHRALPDAEAAMAVFCRLRERARTVDAHILDEIVNLTGTSTWPLRFFFRDAAEGARRGPPTGTADLDGINLDVVRKGLDFGPALTANVQRRPMAADEAAGVFAAAAADHERFPSFEQRPEQVEMAGAVAEALSHEGQLIVEAGTGTGKSLAYLVPAACYALRNNARVLVTTNTINLQEQIVGKDTAELYKLLESGAPADIRGKVGDLRVTQLKGRANYLCLQRLATLRRTPPASDAEARFLTRLLLWLQHTETGDRAELSLKSDEELLWSRVSAENTTCFAGPTYYVRNGTCQLQRARKRAEAAHIVVANHALLLSDLSSGGRALPNYDHLVVDEAHNLEDVATNQFGFQAGQGDLNRHLDTLHLRTPAREVGLVTDVHDALRLVQEGTPNHRLHALAETVAGTVDSARTRIPEVFGAVNAFILNHGEGGSDYDNRLLLTAAKRAQPEWNSVELAWENARTALLAVEDALLKLSLALADANGDDILDYETLISNVAAASQAGMLLRKGVDEIVERHDGDRIAWMTTNRMNGTVSFSSAPLHVGEVLQDYLFERKSSVVLTSATLSTAGSFAYIKDRLGVPEADELMLGSPFDYKRAALVLLPTDMPEPSQREYQRALENAVVDLCTASKGRALVLFTSYAALEATHRGVKRQLEKAGVRVLGQRIDGTPKELVEHLRTNPQTVLLGTSSFWEGVDVVGEALSLLIIAKLPFSVPSDPVFSARSALLDEPFMQFAVPQAGLRFKQGFGRLIRHKADRGVMVVLDRRIQSKRYGRIFLDSLPACSKAQAPLAQLPALVERWLRGNGERGTG